MCVRSLCCVRLFATPWTVAHQAPLSLGFSRQEYWSRLPFPPPGDLCNPGIKPVSLASTALVGGSFTTSATCMYNFLGMEGVTEEYGYQNKSQHMSLPQIRDKICMGKNVNSQIN